MTPDDQIIENKITRAEFDREMFSHLDSTNGKG